jgi:hypothetical protein
MSKPSRAFKVVMSERCFRFKPDALGSHAPKKPGVYEFVTFDAQMQPKVLFVGVAEETIYGSLAAHMMGGGKPTSEELFAAAKDVYFDYVADSDVSSPEDFKDIAGVFIAKHKPRFNTGAAPSSGKYGEVTVEEVG